MKPIIGITCKTAGNITNYIDAIEEHGGKPHVFASLDRSISDHRSSISEYLAMIDGLLLPGGGDINPALFFEKRHPAVEAVSRSRDALEIWLCQDALETDSPVFGICRGIQVMSVAMRGNLYQDIPTQFTNPLRHPKKENGDDSQHEIEIEPNSRLSEIVGKSADEVNSAHHQGVNEIGKRFVVAARSADGVIEAIENPSKRFVLGVQYHPERMTKTPEFREHRHKLFEAFIAAASEYHRLKIESH